MDPRPSRSGKPGSRVYEAPVLRRIELVAEEVLGGGCKTVGAPAVGASTCGMAGCLGLKGAS